LIFSRPVGGRPGVVALYLSSFSVVGTFRPMIDPSTVTPADCVLA
jgi:hypothetical protein